MHLGSVCSIWKNKTNSNQHTMEASAAVTVENQDSRNPKLSLQPIHFLAEEILGGLKIQQSLLASQQAISESGSWSLWVWSPDSPPPIPRNANVCLWSTEVPRPQINHDDCDHKSFWSVYSRKFRYFLYQPTPRCHVRRIRKQRCSRRTRPYWFVSSKIGWPLHSPATGHLISM